MNKITAAITAGGFDQQSRFLSGPERDDDSAQNGCRIQPHHRG